MHSLGGGGSKSKRGPAERVTVIGLARSTIWATKSRQSTAIRSAFRIWRIWSPSPCIGTDLIPVEIDQVIRREATEFVQRSSSWVIEPRKRIDGNPFKEYELRGTIPAARRSEEGRVLGRWGMRV